MVDDNELNRLRGIPRRHPTPTRRRVRCAQPPPHAARSCRKNSCATQGTASRLRLTERAMKLWSEMMQKKFMPRRRWPGSWPCRSQDTPPIYLLKEQPSDLRRRTLVRMADTTPRRTGRSSAASARPRPRSSRVGNPRDSADARLSPSEAGPRRGSARRELGTDARASPRACPERRDGSPKSPASNPTAPRADGRRQLPEAAVRLASEANRAPSDGTCRRPTAPAAAKKTATASRNSRPIRCMRRRRPGLDLLDRRRHRVLFLRAALAEGRLRCRRPTRSASRR